MPTSHSPSRFLDLAATMPLVDVRSPGEFSQGHVPGAVNVPLFTDEERAAVGTCYATQGKETALMLGLELVGPKLPALLRMIMTCTAAAPPSVALYCHKGGMRSQSVAMLLNVAGIASHVVTGGYKACRTCLCEAWEKPLPPILALGGMTGTGKTAILHELSRLGAQVVDLEALARHRGSAFGGLGEQPRNEHFENRLGHAWRSLSADRPVWLENESLHVGTVTLPATLYQRLRDAPLALVSLPQQARVDRILRDYADLEDATLADNLTRLKKRLGGERFKKAMETLERRDRPALVSLLLEYYDRGYADPNDTRLRNPAFTLALTHDEPTLAAQQLLAFESLIFQNQL